MVMLEHYKTTLAKIPDLYAIRTLKKFSSCILKLTSQKSSTMIHFTCFLKSRQFFNPQGR